MKDINADLDQLRIRLSGRKPPKQKAVWQPPVLRDFKLGLSVLALDPSLSDFGWVMFEAHPSGIRIKEKGSIRPAPEATGYWQMWRKAEVINGELWRLHYKYTSVSLVACEAPLVGAGLRKESSEIAGTLAYLVFTDHLSAIAARHASSVLCGNPRHDKREICDAVARYVPEAATRKWNVGQRDALAVGLACLWDLAHPVISK